jgi:hypothetical protein
VRRPAINQGIGRVCKRKTRSVLFPQPATPARTIRYSKYPLTSRITCTVPEL